MEFRVGTLAEGISMLPSIGNIPSLLFFWGIGIIGSLVYYVLMHKKFNIQWYTALFLGLIMILLETFSAKILFLLENPTSIKNGISWTGGYSLFGVFFFTPLILFLISLMTKMKYLDLMDLLMPGILLELAFYRIGCTCAGCCYGIEVGWGISNGTQDNLFPVQPLESILDIGAFSVILFMFLKGKLRSGESFYLTYLLYGFIRFVLEFLRHRTNIAGFLSLSHFFALAILVFGSVMFIYLRLYVTNKLINDNCKRK